MHKLKTKLLTIALLFPIKSFAQTHTIPAGQWSVDGIELGVQPGDTICLTPDEVYSKMLWTNIVGSAEEPILITNCGGKATILSLNGSYGWKFQNSEFFNISGSGSSDHKFGIKVTTDAGFYMSMERFTDNFEISNVEVAGLFANGIDNDGNGHKESGFAGIAIKTKPFCDGSSNRGVWDMENVKVHDNYIHDVGGEGLYIGHGFYLGRIESYCKVDSGNGQTTTGPVTYSHSIKGLRVFNNLVENVAYDGIQIKNADEDAEIYNNVIRNYGTLDVGPHNEGLFVGNGTEASIYNNWVENGTGHGMQIYAFGNTKIFNNVVIDSFDNAIYLNNQSKTVASKEGVFEIYNNTFVGIGKVAIETYPNRRVDDEDKDGVLDYGPLQTVEAKNNIFAGYVSESKGVQTLTNNIFSETVNEMKFTSPENNDYHLTADSPAVGSGTNMELAFDYDYTNRLDGSLDVGAFAYTETALHFISPLSDINVSAGKSVPVLVQVTDDADIAVKVQYVLNNKIIGTDVLPKQTKHTIGKNKLKLGDNTFYAMLVTEDGDIISTKNINIHVDDSE